MPLVLHFAFLQVTWKFAFWTLCRSIDTEPQNNFPPVVAFGGGVDDQASFDLIVSHNMNVLPIRVHGKRGMFLEAAFHGLPRGEGGC